MLGSGWLMGAIDFYSRKTYSGGRWCSSAVRVPTFFKVSFVFGRGGGLVQVWSKWGVDDGRVFILKVNYSFRMLSRNVKFKFHMLIKDSRFTDSDQWISVIFYIYLIFKNDVMERKLTKLFLPDKTKHTLCYYDTNFHHFFL